MFGDSNEKEIKKLMAKVQTINAKEEELQHLSEEELKAKIPYFQEYIESKVAPFKARVAELEDQMFDDEVNLDPLRKKELKHAFEDASEKLNEVYQDVLNEILTDVFAVIKNACRRLVGSKFIVRGHERVWKEVPFDVQLIGGMVLHSGKISEMKTGEGKTFVASLPIILNALTKRGAHLVTVNEYLAARDSEWMGYLYNYLGLSVSVVLSGMSLEAKKEAYNCDITYATNNELGFDYLRDNMAVDESQLVQRDLHFALVDEVDSILVDEARTPLIISAPADESTDKYYMYAKMVNQLREGDHYNIDEKMKAATLTEDGIQKMENLMGVENIYTQGGFKEVHHIEQALKARACFKKDRDYVVRDGEILIVDEFTGRILDGRRYSQGLHQAIEAKEEVEVKRESMTLATVTFQNLFRMYDKLAGMTGTALTEAEEFGKIYKLEVIAIPTNRTVQRIDKPDAIFATEKGKFAAVVRTVKEKYEKGQPVLIGTISIARSEHLSDLLHQEGIQHNVLNAKHHEAEAEIVAAAGQKGAITIATNMAGRGTDIQLSDEAKELGGLCIIGTERHESRRIDNQLRGRSGRQGDPGETQFYVSMDDDLMRIFGGDRMKSIMQTMKVPEDMAIENKMLSSQIEQAQKKVENHHYDVRENVVKYDDVMNKHREIIYARRRRILRHRNLRSELLELLKVASKTIVLTHTSTPETYDWNKKEIIESLHAIYKDETMPLTEEDIENLSRDEIVQKAQDYLDKAYEIRESVLPDKTAMRKIERSVYLRAIDVLWMEHLDNMTYLRQGVSLRGYGQRDPLVEYKSEAFTMFEKLLDDISSNVVHTIFRIDLTPFIPQEELPTVILANDQPEGVTNEKEIEGKLYDNTVDMASIQQKQVQVITLGTKNAFKGPVNEDGVRMTRKEKRKLEKDQEKKK